MDKKIVAAMLPEICPERVGNYVFSQHLDDLGGNIAVYKRVSLEEPLLLARLMDWSEEKRPRRKWAAELTCSCCTETWHTAWVGGPMKAIAVFVAEDDVDYPLFDLEDPDAAGSIVELTHNDDVICPSCGTGLTLVHASKIASGMTRRLPICSLEVVGEYAALMYWMAYRHMDQDGCVYESIGPWYAFVIDKDGKLECFYHRDGWKPSRNREDPFAKKYVCGGNLYNQRSGGWVCPMTQDLTGTTGEKTGIGQYIRSGGVSPLQYYSLWRTYPAVENLVNEGWGRLVECLISHSYYPLEDIYQHPDVTEINWSSRKPHEMLCMDRVAYRYLKKTARDRIGHEWLRAWMRYLELDGSIDANDFDRAWCDFTQYGIGVVLDLMEYMPGLDLPEIIRYLKKQKMRGTEIRVLADTWRMTRLLTGRDILTQEELWPRDIQQRHDDLTAMHLAEKGNEGWMLYLAGFQRIRSKYGDLQWTDGDLEIRIPRDNGELVHEGTVLRHCVGTYGELHVTEKQTIFFVRRHRRPERCYYTLSMDMRKEPKRVQLHGYGNERHGPHKQYHHNIPKKVLDFCDRWEHEIVKPWYLNQKNKKKEEVSA